MNRKALFVAASGFRDGNLSRLAAPGHDISELHDVLSDPAVGNFDVELVVNGESASVRRTVEQFFLIDAEPEDLLLFFYSGHGLKDEAGRLYFAAVDTTADLLRSTGLGADFLNDVMGASRARQQVVVLDCCFSGAFTSGLTPKAGRDPGISDSLAGPSGKGRVVLTASNAIQYSFEASDPGANRTRSVYTAALVDGLRTGQADLDQDGIITATEWHEYALRQLKGIVPTQQPRLWAFDLDQHPEIGRAVQLNPPATTPERFSTARETTASEGSAQQDPALRRGESPPGRDGPMVTGGDLEGHPRPRTRTKVLSAVGAFLAVVLLAVGAFALSRENAPELQAEVLSTVTSTVAAWRGTTTAVTPPPAGKGSISLVSVASDGTQGNDHSINPVISADGRYVAFDSLASNFVENDHWLGGATWRDVFVHDREKSETTRVSQVVDDGVVIAGNGSSHHPRISADGRFVLFVSNATNLDLETNDTNRVFDIYLHDRQTGLNELISMDPDGNQHALNSIDPSMSADGTLIAYATYEGDSRPAWGGSGSGLYTAWVHDTTTGTTIRLAEHDVSQHVDLSPPLVAQNGAIVVAYLGNYYVFDRESYDVMEGSRLGLSIDFRPPVIPDPSGEHLLFYSHEDWLVRDDMNGVGDVFEFDLATGEFSLVMAREGEMTTYPTSVSSDGRFIAMVYEGAHEPAFVFDTNDASLTEVAPTTRLEWLELSADGRWATFFTGSQSVMMTGLDTNRKQDVFVIQLQD